jgi:hypothetical protein
VRRNRDAGDMNRAALALVALIGIGAGAGAQSDQPPAAAVGPRVHIQYQPEEDIVAPLIIDELAPVTVLTIHATGFQRDTTGTVRQCLHGSQRRCQNQLQVRFDDKAAATFQYLVSDEVGSAAGSDEPCRLRAPRCTIELAVGDKISIIDTVFVDEAPPPGRLEVTPRRGLLIGDTVTVITSQFPPGADLTLMICAAPSTSGARCGAPGPQVALTIGPDGTAQTDMVLDAADIGTDRVACGRRVTCLMVVTADQLGVRARPTPLNFAEAPGADYVTTRVIIGLAGALALVVLAGWLIRSSNWDPPSESDATALDDVDYADLDLEADQFDEPEPAPLR